MRGLWTLLLLGGMTMSAMAGLHKETVTYRDGDAQLVGYLVYDDAISGTRPGILVVHEWWGLTDYAKHRADMLAGLGNVAFALDMYGNGYNTTNMDSAKAHAMQMYGDPALMRSRAHAGLNELLKSSVCDAQNVAAIGYCFGGKTVLELARDGAELKGVVSFHGGLKAFDGEDATKIKGKVLALHGGNDPFVTTADVTAFQDEMRAAKVDWQLVVYGGAVHAFTNPASGNDPAKGMAYNESADRRSWAAMQTFFNELFPKK